MKLTRLIRIVLLLTIIFTAGAVTGRLTAPKPPVVIPSADGRFGTSETALARLSNALKLTEEQQRQFRPLLEEMAQGMASLTPASRERLELFQRYVPRMNALLRSDQQPAFARYVKDTKARFQHKLRKATKP